MINTSTQFVFIAGCARSVTTALTRLLNSHPDIYISTEKLMKEFNNKLDEFEPSIFKSNKLKPLIRETTKSHIGDKYSGYYKNYKLIFNRFPNAKVVFIFRNIFDLVESFKNRKADESDNWINGIKRAVKEWKISLTNSLMAIKQRYNIIPVSYDDILFNPSNNIIKRIELNLNLEYTEQNIKICKVANKLENSRVISLSHKEKFCNMKNADFDAFQELVKLSEK